MKGMWRLICNEIIKEIDKENENEVMEEKMK
jgi:hypothetical protein